MRLIDADALKNVEVPINRCFEPAGVRYYPPTWMQAFEVIDKAPTVDAVPVVRCRECIFRTKLTAECTQNGGVWPDDGFCSDGKRREDGLYESLKRGLEEAIAYERGEINCRTERREDGDV